MTTWAIDTEYGFHGGAMDCESRWEPVVFCAVDVNTGQRFHVWGRDDRLRAWVRDHIADTFVAHNAVAEMAYLLRLGIPLPASWFDTRLAWRYISNSPSRAPAKLEDTLKWNGLEKWVPREKKELQESLGNLRFDGDSPDELRRIVTYCYADCEACRVLFQKLTPKVPANKMALWVQFLVATSRMERRGIPIDTKTYFQILERWPEILRGFAAEVNGTCPGAYEGSTLKHGRLVSWCNRNGISWPTKESPTSGNWYYPKDDDTYKDMAERHPLIRLVRETEKAKKAFGKRKMAIDAAAGKHFYHAVTFGAISGRNTNPAFIFSGPKWMRYLIRPESPEHVVVYVDFVAEEFGIAAALSDDPNMVETYQASDCHMEFAIRAGAAPSGATKKTHPQIRKQYKTCNLGTLFGQSAYGLSRRLGIEFDAARAILDDHRRLYSRFWSWSERVVETAYARGVINTPNGWRMKVPSDTKDTVLMNFPMQATGGDIMRLVIVYLDRANVQTLAPVHDGFLMTCRCDRLDDLRCAVNFACETAVRQTLGNFPMRWDFTVYRGRFEDEDGAKQWSQISEFIGKRITHDTEAYHP